MTASLVGVDEKVTAMKKPAFLYDKSSRILLKYGEREEVLSYLQAWKDACEMVDSSDLMDTLEYVEVPAVPGLIEALLECKDDFDRFLGIIECYKGRT